METSSTVDDNAARLYANFEAQKTFMADTDLVDSETTAPAKSAKTELRNIDESAPKIRLLIASPYLHLCE